MKLKGSKEKYIYLNRYANKYFFMQNFRPLYISHCLSSNCHGTCQELKMYHLRLLQTFLKANKSWRLKRCGRNHIAYVLMK